MEVTREDVLKRRVHVQQLDRTLGHPDGRDAAILDIGVQDTGPDGAQWALAIRGCTEVDTFTAWTLRGAPHVYRRSESAGVAAATRPWSSADAARRVFDAARPLKAAGIDVGAALDAIAGEMRDIVQAPTVKGDMSTELTRRMPEPYLRWCNPCESTHLYEQPFRLAALMGGIELRPGTSPPVLERIPGWAGPAPSTLPHLDPVRAYLHLLGPATPTMVAAYVDSPVKDVVARWPEDVTEVMVEGEARSILESDRAMLTEPADVTGTTRLLGPFDLFLQARDRELVIPDADRRKDVWRALGRPGAILSGHEIVGTWRPKASGKKLRLVIDHWSAPDRAALTNQAERLAAYRGVPFDGFVDP